MIRRLAGEGVPNTRIAERLGISRTTVIKAVNSAAPPRYERRPRPTSFAVIEPGVRALLAATPDMPATVLAERVGWEGSIRWFSENVKQLRPEHRPVDPADRLVWAAGDAAQCDLWFPPKKIPLEDGSTKLLPVLVIVAAHSRFVTGQMIPTRKTEDLLLGSWELIRQLGAVPRRLIWDNEPGIGRGQRRAEGVGSFMGALATTLVLLPPRDPESKGIVERRNGWFETSFMPGRVFTCPADFNTQFTGWLTCTGRYRRPARRRAARRGDRLGADRRLVRRAAPAHREPDRAVNRAIVIGEADGPVAGLAALATVDPGLPRHSAASADLPREGGRHSDLGTVVADAARSAPNFAERHHLTRQAARISQALRR